MREERSCKSEERVEIYPQSFKNEWKINGCRVLVSTQIPQFWDTAVPHQRDLIENAKLCSLSLR